MPSAQLPHCFSKNLLVLTPSPSAESPSGPGPLRSSLHREARSPLLFLLFLLFLLTASIARLQSLPEYPAALLSL